MEVDVWNLFIPRGISSRQIASDENRLSINSTINLRPIPEINVLVSCEAIVHNPKVKAVRRQVDDFLRTTDWNKAGVSDLLPVVRDPIPYIGYLLLGFPNPVRGNKYHGAHSGKLASHNSVYLIWIEGSQLNVKHQLLRWTDSSHKVVINPSNLLVVGIVQPFAIKSFL